MSGELIDDVLDTLDSNPISGPFTWQGTEHRVVARFLLPDETACGSEFAEWPAS